MVDKAGYDGADVFIAIPLSIIDATGTVYRSAGECVVVEMDMYERTARAAVWSGSPGDQPQPAAVNREDRFVSERIIWARVPYQARHGRCVAVKRRGDCLWVGVAGSPAVQWLPAQQVLTTAEADAWLAFGF
jgi:hypothetical protein